MEGSFIRWPTQITRASSSKVMDPITHIAARQIVVPLDAPVWLGGSSVKEREYCLVEITSANGLQGHALGFTRGADLVSPVLDQFAPCLLGQDPDDVERLWECMYQRARLNGRQGLLMRALSLLDIALWDLKAKQWKAPLHRVLGGYRDSIPVMMAGGYYSPTKGIPDLCAEFDWYAAEGFRYLKLIVGGASMDEDAQRFAAVRAVLPPGIELGVDANGAWDDPKAVLAWIQKCHAETGGLAFVEEPLPPENRTGLSWLTANSPVPVAVGEFIAGRWTFLEYMNSRCQDIVRADATLCGGISEWKKIAAVANAGNFPLIPHYFASLHLHPALAIPGCRMIEVVSTAGRNSSFHLIAGRSFDLQNGMATSLNKPGLGLELDRDFIAAHTTCERQITSS